MFAHQSRFQKQLDCCVKVNDGVLGFFPEVVNRRIHEAKGIPYQGIEEFLFSPLLLSEPLASHFCTPYLINVGNAVLKYRGVGWGLWV